MQICYLCKSQVFGTQFIVHTSLVVFQQLISSSWAGVDCTLAESFILVLIVCQNALAKAHFISYGVILFVTLAVVLTFCALRYKDHCYVQLVNVKYTLRLFYSTVCLYRREHNFLQQYDNIQYNANTTAAQQFTDCW